MLSAAIVLLAVAAGPRPALHVRLEPDPSLPCPAGAALAAALQRAMPDVQIVTSGAPAPDDLLVQVATLGSGWTLEVTSASGSPLLTRSLDAAGERACSDLADAGALIVDRYLSYVSWPGRAPAVSPLAPPVPPAPPPPPLGLGPPWTVAAGLMGTAGLPEDAAAGLGVELAGSIGQWGRASLLLAVARDLDRAVRVGRELRGTVEVWSAQALLSMGPCGGAGAWQLCAGGLAGALGASASAQGFLYQRRTRTFALPAAGLFARGGWRPWPSLELSGQAAALGRFSQVSVTVEGTEVAYRTPWAEVGLWLLAGWRLQ